MKIALLIIDMQKKFLTHKKDQGLIDEACEHINYVAELLRSQGHLIVHIQDIEGAEQSTPEDLSFIDNIRIHTSDETLRKKDSNAFWKTNLEEVLQQHRVGLVIIAGYAAEYCVLFTFNGAKERGFKTVLLQNGILGKHDDVISATYRDRDVISYPVIEFMVSGNIHEREE